MPPKMFCMLCLLALNLHLYLKKDCHALWHSQNKIMLREIFPIFFLRCESLKHSRHANISLSLKKLISKKK